MGFSVFYREKGEIIRVNVSFRCVKFGMSVRHLSDDIKEEDI